MSVLELAIAIAAKVHAGKVDKVGAPYILHPRRVMLKMETSEEQMAAVLRDVVEDSDTTLDDLRNEGLADAVVDAVDAVTIRSGEFYDEFVRRAALKPIGRRVKLADLEDNRDRSRIANPTEENDGRLAKYKRAIHSIRHN